MANQNGSLYREIAEKRKIMRSEYGGTMSLTDLSFELHVTPHTAKRWGQENGLGILIDRRVKYDTDMVAKQIVMGRGMV